MERIFGTLALSLLSVLFTGTFAHDHDHDHGPSTQPAFVMNMGQWPATVAYRADVLGARVFLEQGSLLWVRLEEGASEVMHDAAQLSEEARNAIQFKGHAWRMRFLDAARSEASPRGNAAPFYHNYFLGNDKDLWASRVPVYDGVGYAGVWPGVDLDIRMHEGNLKYDLLLAAGADPSVIAFAYDGLEGMRVNSEGVLVLTTSVGEVLELRPEVFYTDGGREPIACRYDLQGNELRFGFPEGYDRTRPVTIDPILVAGTYSGATGASNYGHCASYDGFGNIYTGARNFGPTYPASVGAFQTSFGGGGTDVSLSKYNPDGSQLIWASYLGGSGTDNPHSLISNPAGDLIVLGSTTSTNFPITSGAYDGTLAGQDITVTRISTDGTTLLGSTFMGGSGSDGTNTMNGNYGEAFRGEVYLDPLGNIIVASFTSSADFPVTPGAFQPANGGGQDGVLFKLNPTCSSLMASTFIGGSSGDNAMGLRLAANGDILVAGTTASSNFPTTPGSFLPTFIGGATDAWVGRFTSDLTTLVASTFFGTASGDRSYFLDTDGDDNIWIYGQTDGALNITPAGTYGQAGGKIFLAKLTSDLSAAPVISTMGPSSSPGTVPVAFLVDVCDQIYICGYNTTAQFPLTADALYSSGSFYLAVFDAEMQGLLYGTYYGGSHVDGGTSRFDKNGIVYQGVCSGGNSMQSAPWAYATNNQLGWDIAVFKIDMQQAGVQATITTDAVSGCAPASFTFNASGVADVFIWDLGDGSPQQTGQQASHTYTAAGIYNLVLIGVDSASCNVSDTTFITITVNDPSNMQALFTAVPSSSCTGYGVQLTNTSVGGDAFVWDVNGTPYDQPNPYHQFALPGTYPVTITLTDLLCGGTATLTQNVIIEPATIEYELASPVIICDGGTVQLNAGLGFSGYLWSTGEQAAIIDVYETGIYTVTVTQGLCEGTSSIEVVEAPVPEPMLDVSTCPGLPVPLDPGFELTSILWNTGSTDESIEVDAAGLYWFTAIDALGCTVRDTVEVLLLPATDAAGFIPNVFTPNGDGWNDRFEVAGLGLQEFRMEVYNRWGQVMYETNNVQFGWNGGVDNTSSAVPDGTYYYIITYRDLCAQEPDTKKVGHVTMLR